MSEKKLSDWAWPYIKNFRTYIDIGASTGKTSAPYIGKFEKIIVLNLILTVLKNC
jgi:hypothetical protein